jgi:hypothetical protein
MDNKQADETTIAAARATLLAGCYRLLLQQRARRLRQQQPGEQK